MINITILILSLTRMTTSKSSEALKGHTDKMNYREVALIHRNHETFLKKIIKKNILKSFYALLTHWQTKQIIYFILIDIEKLHQDFQSSIFNRISICLTLRGLNLRWVSVFNRILCVKEPRNSINIPINNEERVLTFVIDTLLFEFCWVIIEKI